MKIRSVYDGSRVVVTAPNTQPSMTLQSFADECDTDRILKRYSETGTWGAGIPVAKPQFGDFTGTSFEEAQNKLLLAREWFLSLPATLREQFGNNVANAVNYINDPKNHESCIKLGLLDAPLNTAQPQNEGAEFVKNSVSNPPQTHPEKGD